MTAKLTSRIRIPEWSATKPFSEELASSTDEDAPIDLVVGRRHTPVSDSTESMQVSDEQELRVLRMPAFKSVTQGGSFGAMQEWEGVVTAIDGENFCADLYDITAGGVEPNETAEIPVEDLQPEDVGRLQVGAIFRWVVGYHKSSGGIRTRGFRIHFREPMVLAEEEVLPDLVFSRATHE